MANPQFAYVHVIQIEINVKIILDTYFHELSLHTNLIFSGSVSSLLLTKDVLIFTSSTLLKADPSIHRKAFHLDGTWDTMLTH